MDAGLRFFDDYRAALRGTTLSHAWRGDGSTIILEFGALSPRLRQDGSQGQPGGQMSLMIEGSWRMEGADRILCGSASDEALFQPWLDRLVGRTVIDLELFGRLPEIMLTLSDRLYVTSLATAQGHPAWALIDSREGGLPVLHSKDGRVCEEEPS